MHLRLSFFLLLILFVTKANAQQTVDRKKFFQDTSIVNASIILNTNKVFKEKIKENQTFPAKFIWKVNDSTILSDRVTVQLRGHFRRANCSVPPLLVTYKTKGSNVFRNLKTLKLVSACRPMRADDENLLKEFLIYKMYNLVTDKSFRVRLLNLSYVDSVKKKVIFTQHAFLMEDIKDVAKRNNCVNWSKKRYDTESTDRQQMTIMAFFEYMIGNTDWSVPSNHNVKLIHAKADSTSKPYVVPYDFDFSGLVNAEYAFPDEDLNIKSVQVRLYRGYPRELNELNAVIAIFNQQKEAIYNTIGNFNLLDPITKDEMTSYLDDFYKTINKPSEVKNVFINNARRAPKH